MGRTSGETPKPKKGRGSKDETMQPRIRQARAKPSPGTRAP
jgi:hypothetical protein